MLCVRTKQTKKLLIILSSGIKFNTVYFGQSVRTSCRNILRPSSGSKGTHLLCLLFDLEDRGDMSLRNISLPSPNHRNYSWNEELFVATVMRTCSPAKGLFLLSYKPFSKWPPCSRTHNSVLRESETRRCSKVSGLSFILLENC
jgi:hypothetical protein